MKRKHMSNTCVFYVNWENILIWKDPVSFFPNSLCISPSSISNSIAEKNQSVLFLTVGVRVPLWLGTRLLKRTNQFSPWRSAHESLCDFRDSITAITVFYRVLKISFPVFPGGLRFLKNKTYMKRNLNNWNFDRFKP